MTNFFSCWWKRIVGAWGSPHDPEAHKAAAEVEAAAEAEAEAVEADVGDVVVSTEQAASPKGQPLLVFITTTGEVFV